MKIAALLMMIATSVACAPTPAAHGNILANPGFELGGDGIPSGWAFDEAMRSKGAVEIEQNAGYGGSAALRLVPNGRNSSDVVALNVAQGFDPKSLRGKTLAVSARLGAEAGATALFSANIVDRQGRILANVTLTQGSNGTGLKQHSERLEVPDEGALLVVLCQVHGTSGHALFDDVSVEAVPKTQQAKAASAAEPLSAKIRVDGSRDVRRIPRGIYGTNIAWSGAGTGIMFWDKGGYNPQVVDLAHDLGTTLLRFPGGILSDHYDWRAGVGPRSKRPEVEPYGKGSGDPQQNLFGTDEALEFARRVGGELLITVNAGTGSPEEAAAWIRYVNGSDRSSPPKVVNWEVGNELYLKSNISIPPDEYARRFVAFASAMREADPRIRIGALGTENIIADAGFAATYPDWNRKVLEAGGHQMDFFAVHNAYAPAVVVSGSEQDVRSVYRAMLAAPLLIAESLERTAADIERYASERASKISIAVTEWAPFFAFSPQNRYMDHVKTLGSALYTASVLKVFLESPRVEVANFYGLTGFASMALIAPRQGVDVRDWLASKPDLFAANASYYAFQLYSRHFGDVVVHSTSESPTFDSPAAGFVRAMKGVPLLDVIASRDEDRGALQILVVNKHFDSPITASLEVAGFEVAPEATVWTLDGAGIDAHTGTAPMQVPQAKWVKPARDVRNPRIDKGGPDEVRFGSRPLSGVGSGFEYTFPAHSVTLLELRAK